MFDDLLSRFIMTCNIIGNYQYLSSIFVNNGSFFTILYLNIQHSHIDFLCICKKFWTLMFLVLCFVSNVRKVCNYTDGKTHLHKMLKVIQRLWFLVLDSRIFVTNHLNFSQKFVTQSLTRHRTYKDNITGFMPLWAF